VNALKTLTLLLAVPLAAQAPQGTWTLGSAPDVPAIIEAATKDMNFVKRPIARSRLRKANPVYQRIQISRAGAEFLVKYDDREPQHMPADGKAVAWKREDGEKFQIAAREGRDELVQTYQAEDAVRTNVFTVDPRTRALTLTVTIKSEKLPAPVTYTIAYKAAP
jgi:hypothetical protein